MAESFLKVAFREWTWSRKEICFNKRPDWEERDGEGRRGEMLYTGEDKNSFSLPENTLLLSICLCEGMLKQTEISR